MKKSTIIITGCDANFYHFMDQCLRSLTALNLDQRAEIGILDLGLTDEQVSTLKAKGYIVQKPTWPDFIPLEMRKSHYIGLYARTELREYFPGFNVYLWFDADAWAQTPEFFDSMVEGAKAKDAAFIREDGAGYHRDFKYNKWWFGNLMLCYGMLNAVKIGIKPAINIGLLAMSDTAPHWKIWQEDYKRCILKINKISMDQHSVCYIVEKPLPYAQLPARCNWITVLSTPTWDTETRMICDPGNGRQPLSVLHLAGPDKTRNYTLKTLQGGEVITPLTYDLVMPLRQGLTGGKSSVAA